ncbi:MAG: DNA translocase FtsK [Deltaproteobacteria bacterium]|jgi:S-DNA-T family DNA segregation ATPase FtsK/SpoIIIE|nr:DNA translocase FtsK [Deltaproteobacteria bacterium]
MARAKGKDKAGKADKIGKAAAKAKDTGGIKVKTSARGTKAGGRGRRIVLPEVSTPKIHRIPRIPPELPALLSLFLGVALLLSLLSHTAGDLSLAEGARPGNYCGALGALVSDLLVRGLGLAAFLPVLALLLPPYYTLTKAGRAVSMAKALVGLAMVSFSILTMAELIFPEGLSRYWGIEAKGGGIIGGALAGGLTGILGRVGSLAALPPLLIAGLLMLSGLSLAGIWQALSGFSLDANESRGKPLGAAEGAGKGLSASGPEQQPVSVAKAPKAAKAAPPEPPEPLKIREKPKPQPKQPEPPERKAQASVLGRKPGPYRLPPLDLLDPPRQPQGGDPGGLSREELTANAGLLETKLREFGVEGRVLEVAGGPVITMYEYQPAPGIKISKVAGLATDLAMAMRAESIRVVAPIPGKAAIGLELPNEKRAIVTLRELVESPAFQKLRSPLSLVLGVDIVGSPVVTDLGRMPHLLIAGATGSGKSVGLDCMIMSILFKAPPNLVRFLMIDPKCVELALYQDLPHLIHPVLTDPGEATMALRWAVHEMDERYRLMAGRGVRNIQGYNESLPTNGSRNGIESMPYLVIIIDELSDLMIQAPKDVETCIMRLSAKARAAGIHLILATQRPSVDVLTGVIKANLPTRISFQVATKFDSRTILDQVGAEQLLGKGDMLFQPPGAAKLSRLHGAYVSDLEKKKVTDFIRSQAPPDYLESLEPPAVESEGASSSGRDDRFQEAVELVRSSGKATISFVQRRMGVGYNRAANIIEQMEREGVVGPQEGARPREIY